VLSELPELWQRHLSRWSQLNRGKRRHVDEGPAPDREDEYLLYQTLAGLWSPELDTNATIQRLQAYMSKAGREAKRSTSWINPNAEYEAAVGEFIVQLLSNPERNAFLRDFSSLATILMFFGRINSLATTALKITAPGVPDFYQGTELPVLTLVDPDNRAPVDFEAASRRLGSLAEVTDVGALLEDADGARAKLYVTSKLLQLRAADDQLFAQGAYQPLQVEGEHKDHVFAFARVHEGRGIVVVLQRWTARLMRGETSLPLGDVWADTKVVIGGTLNGTFEETLAMQPAPIEPEGEERSLRVTQLFAKFPLSVLRSTPA
jgi:(1->4)-alpha-D-glucan 1-alpha-D-glucosylmutase